MNRLPGQGCPGGPANWPRSSLLSSPSTTPGKRRWDPGHQPLLEKYHSQAKACSRKNLTSLERPSCGCLTVFQFSLLPAKSWLFRAMCGSFWEGMGQGEESRDYF